MFLRAKLQRWTWFLVNHLLGSSPAPRHRDIPRQNVGPGACLSLAAVPVLLRKVGVGWQFQKSEQFPDHISVALKKLPVTRCTCKPRTCFSEHQCGRPLREYLAFLRELPTRNSFRLPLSKRRSSPRSTLPQIPDASERPSGPERSREGTVLLVVTRLSCLRVLLGPEEPEGTRFSLLRSPRAKLQRQCCQEAFRETVCVR